MPATKLAGQSTFFWYRYTTLYLHWEGFLAVAISFRDFITPLWQFGTGSTVLAGIEAPPPCICALAGNLSPLGRGARHLMFQEAGIVVTHGSLDLPEVLGKGMRHKPFEVASSSYESGIRFISSGSSGRVSGLRVYLALIFYLQVLRVAVCWFPCRCI